MMTSTMTTTGRHELARALVAMAARIERDALFIAPGTSYRRELENDAFAVRELIAELQEGDPEINARLEELH